jgi:zinc and cadmium transporter
MMVPELVWILGATIVVSLISLVGVFTLWITKKALDKLLLILVAFSAGALLGGAMLHILPEAIEEVAASSVFLYVLMGFALFFILERVLYWHHCHEGVCEVHPFSYLILFGDTLHNFIDGITIAVSFIVSIPFGIVTTFLIIGHEIPQELGDFGVLVYGGMSKLKALVYNLFSQAAAIVGGIIGFFLSGIADGVAPIALSFAAGGFIYIAASDLIPELHKEPDQKKSIISFAVFLFGLAVMWGLKAVFGG